MSKCYNSLCQLYIDCIQTFFAHFGLEGNGIAFANFVDKAGNVNEYLLAGGRVNNESKAFGFVKELDSSCLHTEKIEKMKSNHPEGQGKGKGIY